MAEVKKYRKAVAKKSTATHITIWSENGSPVSDDILDAVEQAVTTAIMAAQFNSGVRLLTETTRV